MSAFDAASLASAAVHGLAPYVPGKPVAELARELGLDDIVKLASNENASGPSPRAIAAMQAALPDAWIYPDGSGHDLKRSLSRRLGVDPARLTLGNGSNDVLVLLAEAFLAPGTEAVYSQYCFAVYPIAVRATGAHGVEIPALARTHAMPLGHDLSAMLAAITPRTRLVFVANPNNPTGTWASADELRRFVAAVPRHTLVIVDEAYFEYAVASGCQNAIEWLDAYPHLVVVRTFSKAYGLAGLRAGFAVSHAGVADMLNRVRQPFNMNLLALAAAEAALEDDEHLRRSVDLAVRERQVLERGLGAMGVRTIPSAGNFVLAEFGARAGDIDRALLQQGIIVRPVANYGLPNHLRITVGLPPQNARLLEVLRHLLASTPGAQS